jgi:hypothetical protein
MALTPSGKPLVKSVFLITGLLLLSASCRGQEQAVSIGPGIFTFPEIAKKLSVSGRTVVCPTTLRNRAAVVSLKNREWKQATELLGGGLDLRIRQTDAKQNLWILERDPAVLAREEPWLRHLAEELRKSVIKSAEAQSIPPSEIYGETIQRYLRLTYALEETQKQDPNNEKPENARLSKEHDQAGESLCLPDWYSAKVAPTLTIPAILTAIKNRSTFQRVDWTRFYNAKAINDLNAFLKKEDDEYRARLLAQGETPTESTIGFKARMKRLKKGDWTGASRLRFDLHRLWLSSETIIVADGEPQLDEHIYSPQSSPGEDPTEVSLLGPDFETWLKKEQSSTDSFLKTDVAKLPLGLPSHIVSRTISSDVALSEVLESYATKNGGEVIQELYPTREALDSFSFKAYRDSGNKREALTPGTLDKLVEIQRSSPKWSFSEQNGVLVAKNQLACVDRYHDYHLAPLLALEKRFKSEPDRYQISRFSNLLAFHRSITAEENAALAEIGDYRRIEVHDITAARPIVLLLAHFPASEMKRVLASPAKNRHVDIPLGDLPELTLQEVARSIRELLINTGGQPQEALLNGFPSLLRRCRIRVEEGNVGDNFDRVFSVLPVTDKGPDEESTYGKTRFRDFVFP